MTMDVMQWLQEVRKLPVDLLEAMQVRAVDHPKLGRAVAFPYLRNGKGYAAKFRTVDKGFASTAGVSRGLFNEDELRCREALPLVITEGEIDCLSVIQAGFDRCVSIPNGWGETTDHCAELAEAEECLRKSPHVIVAGDNDAAGAGLPLYVARLLRGHDVRLAVWPDGCKDANDVLVKFGEGRLAEALNAAKRIDPPGGLITGISDPPPLDERRVLRVDLYPFNQVFAFELGGMSVFTGIPGHGKSTLLLWGANQCAKQEGIRVGLIAFETDFQDIRDQLALNETGLEFRDLFGEQRQQFMERMDRRFRIVHDILDDDVPENMAWLRDQVETLVLRDGCKLIIVDPWNELEHEPVDRESMTNYINAATKFIRQMAKRLNCHICVVAHPKKMPTDGGRSRAPTGYDVADSAAFYNKPSLGVTVHQNERQNEDKSIDKWVELHVWKVRKTRLYGFGKGKVNVEFDEERMAFRRRTKKEAEI
jgi:twinkle protein